MSYTEIAYFTFVISFSALCRDSFTAKAKDWELFLSIENLDYKQARSIETHIKKMKSIIFIKNLKKYPEMISNLVEKYKEV